MVARIQTYQRTESMAAPMNVAHAQSAVSPNSPMAAAAGNLSQSLGQLSGNLARVAHDDQREAEESAREQVYTVLAKADVAWQKTTTERFNAYKPGDPALDETIGKEFDTWKTEQEKNLPTEKSRRFFNQHAEAMKAKLQTGAFAFQEKTRAVTLEAETDEAEKADRQTVFSDPSRYDEVLRRRVETIIPSKKMTEVEKLKEATRFKASLADAAERGELEADPQGYYRRRFGTFDAREPGAGGGPVIGASRSIADAIYGQESSGGKADTSKVNSQNVTGPMQMQEATFEGMKAKGLIPKDYDWKNPENNKAAGYKWVEYLSDKYNGNVDKVAAAYYGGEGAVKSDGTIHREWKNKQRPDDPTVGDYVDQVKARMGGASKREPVKVASVGNVPIGKQDDAPSPPASFTTLEPERQLQFKHQAEALMKQKVAEQFADVALSSARSVIEPIELAPDAVIDLPKAKADAVAKARDSYGALNERQVASIETAVEKAAADKERDRKRQEATDLQDSFAALDENGGDIVAFQKQNQPLLSRLGRGAKDRVEKYAGEVATGQTRTTDWVAYQSLVENPAALKVANLDAVKDKFGANELGQLAKMQERLNKDTGHEDNIRSNLTLVKEMLKEAKVTDDKKEAKFFSMLQTSIDQELAATGKKALKQSEIKALADDLLVKTITSKGILWDSTERSFAIQVPVGERAKIEAALQANGLPVTDYEVMRQYRKKLDSKSVLQKPAAAQQPAQR